MADNVIEYTITGDTSGANKAFGSLESAIGSATKILGVLGVAMGAIDFVKFIGNQLEVADQMGKMALKSGVAVDTFSAMTHAFALSDVSAEQLSGSFKFLNKSIDEAKQGNDSAIKSFESIGISMQDLKKDSPSEVLLKIADAFTKIEDPSARNTMLLEKFGRAGLELAPAMAEGRAGIEKLMKQAQDLGLVVDQDFANAAQNFNDSMQTVKAASEGAGRQFGKILLPVLNDTIGTILEFTKTGTGSVVPWGQIVSGVVAIVAGAIISFVATVKNAFAIISGVLDVFATSATAVFGAVKQAMEGDFAGAWKTVTTAVKKDGEIVTGTFDTVKNNAVTVGDGFKKLYSDVANYGQGIKAVGDTTKKASEIQLNPVSKEAAGRLEELRKKQDEYYSNLLKAEKQATGDKLGQLNIQYQAEIKKLDELKFQGKAYYAAKTALDNAYSAQRQQLQNELTAQLGITDLAYRDLQVTLANQEYARMIDSGISKESADRALKSKLMANEIAYMQARDGAISDNYKTNDEIVKSRAALEDARIKKAYADGLIDNTTYQNALKENAINSAADQGDIFAKMEKAKISFQKKSLGDQLSQTKTGLDALGSLMNDKNRDAFEIGKAAAIVNATIQTYVAATGAYASLASIPIVGPALGIAAAAAAVVAGIANVRKIGSQQYGQAHAGLTNVPSEGTYLLQKGERVLAPEQNKDFTNFINNSDGGGGGGVQIGTVAITISVPNGEALRSLTKREWEDIAVERIIPAFNVLDRKGVRPNTSLRYAR